MKIATWNVNSIKVRIGAVCDWIERQQPDVLLLQELKTTAEAFPRLEIEALGYRCAIVGQRTYNGVAILSRHPLEDVAEGLPGEDEDDHARYVEATVLGLRIASIYLPNGNPVDSDKFPYKLRWMGRLRARIEALIEEGRPFVLGGDYNVIPDPRDVHDPRAWADDALFRMETRRAWRGIVNLGLTDAFRALHPTATHAYTFWDYQAGAWQRDNGIRIDHLLLSPEAADRLTACAIDKDPRGLPKASDHTPIWCEIADRVPADRFV
ncbi:MAG: exodeoxyribonuclease III [Alphaproteobacteria bacterium]